MKKIIPVTKVAFHGSTGDNRSPEDLALPACMASLMEALGENYEIQTIHAHNQEYTKRTANDQFLGASGMAFGLLWHKEFCMSSMDVMQVNEHNETIRRAFAWAGYQYELIENNGSNTDEVFEKAILKNDN